MKIKKTFQGNLPENKVLNSKSESQTDAYSCDYINKLNMYSTEEQAIGKWIDGKKLYRKVVPITLGTSTAWVRTGTLLYNIDTIVSSEATIKAATTEANLDAIYPIDSLLCSVRYSFMKNTKDNSVAIQTKQDDNTFNNRIINFIVVYTKTTD